MSVSSSAADESGNLFDQLREGFAFVAANADHVKIRHDRLASYTESLTRVPRAAVFDEAHHYKGTGADLASYVLVLDSINFGSGFERKLVAEGWERVDNSLYYTVSTRLKEYYELYGALQPDQLGVISDEIVATILGLSLEKPYSRRFAAMCTEALQDLGHLLEDRYNGSFLEFVVSANGSAGQMVEQLLLMKHFRDAHDYKGHRIGFYKRAQITAADLQLAFRELGQTLLSDIDRLTMFPDNGVPHVLHLDGILEYTPELTAKIANEVELPSGSAEEVEIRACAAHVVELIAKAKNMTAMDVDHILWHRSVENKHYKEQPSHRTLSLFY